MLDTAAQSGQAVMLNLRYDIRAEWAAFVNGTANFAGTLSRERFPYIVQGAAKLTIDAARLYAANGMAIVRVTPRSHGAVERARRLDRVGLRGQNALKVLDVRAARAGSKVNIHYDLH